MSRAKSKNLKAITLIEVVLAVTILLLGLVLVGRSFITSLRAIKMSHNFLVAHLLLEEKIWQKQEEQARPEGFILDDEEEKFAPPFEAFSYKINFTEQEGAGGLFKSTFEVYWQRRGRERRGSCLKYLRSRKE